MKRAITTSPEQRERLRISPGYLFIAPAVILIVFMAVYPTFRVLYLSVMDYSRRTREVSFVDIQNYVKIIQDPVFQQAFKQTLILPRNWTPTSTPPEGHAGLRATDQRHAPDLFPF